MSTPSSFTVRRPSADEVSVRLQQELRPREETTPEPIFRNKPTEQEYTWLCEIYHGNFTIEELDGFRMGICDVAYWEREAEYFKTICPEMTQKDPYHHHAENEADAAAVWRNRCLALRQFLREIGLDTQELH
ncbi:hypothetical protein V8C42DRAFT_309443 [Trichoderma barbatum]